MTPRGRRPIGGRINLRLGDELLAAVSDLAEAEGRSQSDVIRRACRRAVRDGISDPGEVAIEEAVRRIMETMPPPPRRRGTR